MASSAHSEDSSSSIFTSSATDSARCLAHAWSQAYAVLCLQKKSRARDFSLWQRGHFSRCLANLSVTALLAAARFLAWSACWKSAFTKKNHFTATSVRVAVHLQGVGAKRAALPDARKPS